MINSRKPISLGVERGRTNNFSPYIKKELYLVHMVGKDMSVEYIIRLNDIMKGWAEFGAAVLFLTLERDVNIGINVGKNNDINFNELDLWPETVSRLNELGYDGK